MPRELRGSAMAMRATFGCSGSFSTMPSLDFTETTPSTRRRRAAIANGRALFGCNDRYIC